MPHAPNDLVHETSPYLLQHAYNPVRWQPWGEKALAEAKLENKPILLSVGYSACHWCHVMERESFENPEIAALMNDFFVPIKVDREERPDVDSVYMTAVQVMTGAGGWPMTVFLTPEAKPFYGGTYYPPEDRFGRPGFKRVLTSLHDAWQNRRSEVLESAEDLTSALARFERFAPNQNAPTETNASKTVETLEKNFDDAWGGFGAAPKFPNPGGLEFLLLHHARTGKASALEMCSATLRHMSQGGIFDHLGGGFARYSTDERWLVPHFEKMLYDNAQLARVYMLAHQHTGQPDDQRDFFLTAKETLEYMAREMQHPLGGFYSAQDADSEGVEGKFFVWQQSEIEAVLGVQDAALFCQHFGVSAGGNWERNNVLHRNQGTPLDEETHSRLESAKTKLFLRREGRIKPGLDDKILTSWNGLALQAFALAGRSMGGRAPKYLKIALQNAVFVREHLYTNGRLWHTWKNGVAKIPGLLEDYAFYALGLLELYQSTFDQNHLDWALELTQHALDFFKDPGGGFFDTAHDGETLIVRPKSYFDSAYPSGNGAMAVLLCRLGHCCNKPEWLGLAQEIVSQMQELAPTQPTGFGSVLAAQEYLLAKKREVVIAGPLEREDTQALLRVLRPKYLPFVAVVAGESNLPVAEGRTQVNDQAAAYVCQGMACNLPVTSAQELEAMLG